MRPHDLRQQCAEWHIPYLGPSVEECNDYDDYGDYQYEIYAQQQLDEQMELDSNE